MLVTVAVNLLVIAYESREAKRLASEVLFADAMQTRGDVWTSVTRDRGARRRARSACRSSIRWPRSSSPGSSATPATRSRAATTQILSDRIVIAESDIEQVVMSVPGVLGCHQHPQRADPPTTSSSISTCGCRRDAAAPKRTTLSHVVKDRLMARYPQIADAHHPHRAAAETDGLARLLRRISLRASSAQPRSRTSRRWSPTSIAAPTARIAIGNDWTRRAVRRPVLRRPAAIAGPAVDQPGVRPVSRPQHGGEGSRPSSAAAEADLHLIYEGLSRVAADAVLSGAGTVRGGDIVFSTWHPNSWRCARRSICRATRSDHRDAARHRLRRPDRQRPRGPRDAPDRSRRHGRDVEAIGGASLDHSGRHADAGRPCEAHSASFAPAASPRSRASAAAPSPASSSTPR